MVGKVLGNRYRVLREIGSGGMAWVYLAEDIKESYLVAVKVLYPQFGEDLSYIHRFNREAKLASAMTDPHIVRVLDYGADRDIYYLVMEYIEGRDLREMLAEKGRYAWRQALDILDQLATALEHAHVHGVVHRDIKPQNLMLDDSGMLKVLDFGIARISTLPSLTQSGFIGSPYYVSPEQAMSEEVDIRSDIYSAGIVFYEMLSGNIPFDAKSPWSIISQHIANEPPPIELEEKDAPVSVHDLLGRMVAKQREDRFQTPNSLRRAISATLSGRSLPEDTVDTRPISAPDQVDMADSLFHRALEAIEAEEWPRASDLLHQALKLNPEHQAAQEKLVLAEHHATLISGYNTAIRAMERKAWQESVEKFKRIVEADPEYRDAQVLLEQCQTALTRENIQGMVVTRYAEGVSHFESSRWEEALQAFQEVQSLSPGYKRVEEYIQDTERLSKSSLLQQLQNLFSSQESWGRWGLIGVGIVAIIFTFVFIGNRNPATGDDSVKEELKLVYQDAQQAISQNNTEEAIVFLDKILGQDPDYADAADLRRELVISLTPTPTPEPTVTIVPTATPMLENLLDEQLTIVEEAFKLGSWSDMIDSLREIRDTDPDYETALVSSLFCDAYVGRGLQTLSTLSGDSATDVKSVETAFNDFETGATECSHRTDLQEQAERAMTYLEMLKTPRQDHDTLIQGLTSLVAANSDYAAGNAKELLYLAYLSRGDSRKATDETVGALGDYEAALALNVADPTEAQTRLAELLLSFQQSQSPPVIEVVGTPPPTVTPGGDLQTPIPNEATTPEPVRITLKRPTLQLPEDDASFAGIFADVVLEWEANHTLTDDEYYDLTIMHIFADEPRYWGVATKETTIKLIPEDIGVGTAGNDRFYWWVTIRKEGTSPGEGALDLPRSPRSAARTFVWVP